MNELVDAIERRPDGLAAKTVQRLGGHTFEAIAAASPGAGVLLKTLRFMKSVGDNSADPIPKRFVEEHEQLERLLKLTAVANAASGGPSPQQLEEWSA